MSEARKKANTKFNTQAYDRIQLVVPKGQKDEIRAHAEQYQQEVGEVGKPGYTPKGSINGFIVRAIDEKMARDKAVSAFTVQPTDKEDE